jgi:aspartyl-tRNA(Asn)/glutamyl-tRNA(Gln) amidotransferase subunit C
MPSTWTRADVERVARLARLELSEPEIALFQRQLADILTYAELVRQVDTTDVPPTSHPLGTSGSGRDDVPAASIDRTALLAQAPGASVDAGLFKVPKVL